MYAIYAGCDPLSKGIVTKSDQVCVNRRVKPVWRYTNDVLHGNEFTLLINEALYFSSIYTRKIHLFGCICWELFLSGTIF